MQLNDGHLNLVQPTWSFNTEQLKALVMLEGIINSQAMLEDQPFYKLGQLQTKFWQERACSTQQNNVGWFFQ